jgi:hypothetical protein
LQTRANAWRCSRHRIECEMEFMVRGVSVA